MEVNKGTVVVVTFAAVETVVVTATVDPSTPMVLVLVGTLGGALFGVTVAATTVVTAAVVMVVAALVTVARVLESAEVPETLVATEALDWVAAGTLPVELVPGALGPVAVAVALEEAEEVKADVTDVELEKEVEVVDLNAGLVAVEVVGLDEPRARDGGIEMLEVEATVAVAAAVAVTVTTLRTLVIVVSLLVVALDDVAGVVSRTVFGFKAGTVVVKEMAAEPVVLVTPGVAVTVTWDGAVT